MHQRSGGLSVCGSQARLVWGDFRVSGNPASEGREPAVEPCECMWWAADRVRTQLVEDKLHEVDLELALRGSQVPEHNPPGGRDLLIPHVHQV